MFGDHENDGYSAQAIQFCNASARWPFHVGRAGIEPMVLSKGWPIHLLARALLLGYSKLPFSAVTVRKIVQSRIASWGKKLVEIQQGGSPRNFLFSIRSNLCWPCDTASSSFYGVAKWPSMNRLAVFRNRSLWPEGGVDSWRLVLAIAELPAARMAE